MWEFEGLPTRIAYVPNCGHFSSLERNQAGRSSFSIGSRAGLWSHFDRTLNGEFPPSQPDPLDELTLALRTLNMWHRPSGNSTLVVLLRRGNAPGHPRRHIPRALHASALLAPDQVPCPRAALHCPSSLARKLCGSSQACWSTEGRSRFSFPSKGPMPACLACAEFFQLEHRANLRPPPIRSPPSAASGWGALA